MKKQVYISFFSTKCRQITIKPKFVSFIVIVSFIFVILSFLSGKNEVLQSNTSNFVEEAQIVWKRSQKLNLLPFKKNCSKSFVFSKNFVGRAPSTRGNPFLMPPASLKKSPSIFRPQRKILELSCNNRLVTHEIKQEKFVKKE